MTRPESMTSPRWSTVFFKVENSIFEVPRHRFTEYSEIFEDMFGIPQAGDGVEGKDEGHPITLDGYESADFRALIKVLYPAYVGSLALWVALILSRRIYRPLHAVVSGSYTIAKEEWVGVLNLSTRWQMKEIRKHAINELSKMSLGPLEKVVLARAHKVGKWLEEGLNEIVVERPVRCPEELKSQLGLETAFLLMWVQNQSSVQKEKELVTLRCVVCPSCDYRRFDPSYPIMCHGCNLKMHADNHRIVYLDESPSPTATPLSATLLRCSSCFKCPIWPGTLSCDSCSFMMDYTDLRLKLPDAGGNSLPKMEVNINDAFKEEIASYESWYQ